MGKPKTMTTKTTQGGGATKRVLIGTSGFSFPEWRGIFYPEDLSPKKYLQYYAEHFPTTEINLTFHRFLRPNVSDAWCAETPDDFSFTLKLSRWITHIKRLKEVEGSMERFLEGAAGLKEKLGPILVQLPPNFKKDLAVLDEFLEKFSKKAQLACEFRHHSWTSDDVFDVLKKHETALVIVERDEVEVTDTWRVVTAPFVYVRLRRSDYSADDVERWAKWIEEQSVDVYCYVKHDERAPVFAKQLLDKI